jgi:hypothetical protein
MDHVDHRSEPGHDREDVDERGGLAEGTEEQRAGCGQRCHHGPGDESDPTEDREHYDVDRGNETVARHVRMPASEREQHAAEPGQSPTDAEGEQLDAYDVDAQRCRGALVRPHREHPPAGRTPPQVGDDQRREHKARQTEEPVSLRV